MIGPRTCGVEFTYSADSYAHVLAVARVSGWIIEDDNRLAFCKKCARPIGWPGGGRVDKEKDEGGPSFAEAIIDTMNLIDPALELYAKLSGVDLDDIEECED